MVGEKIGIYKIFPFISVMVVVVGKGVLIKI